MGTEPNHSRHNQHFPALKVGQLVEHESGWKGEIQQILKDEVVIRSGQMLVTCNHSSLKALSKKNRRTTKAHDTEQTLAQAPKTHGLSQSEIDDLNAEMLRSLEGIALPDSPRIAPPQDKRKTKKSRSIHPSFEEEMRQGLENDPEIQSLLSELNSSTVKHNEQQEPVNSSQEELPNPWQNSRPKNSDWVYIGFGEFDVQGKVVSVQNDTAIVEVQKMSIEAPLDRLRPSPGPGKRLTSYEWRPPAKDGYQSQKENKVEILDLHGLRSDIIENVLHTEIYRCMQRGIVAIELIHGYRHGTALLETIQGLLSSSPLKDMISHFSYVPERNPGITIAYLEN